MACLSASVATRARRGEPVATRPLPRARARSRRIAPAASRQPHAAWDHRWSPNDSKTPAATAPCFPRPRPRPWSGSLCSYAAHDRSRPDSHPASHLFTPTFPALTPGYEEAGVLQRQRGVFRGAGHGSGPLHALCAPAVRPLRRPLRAPLQAVSHRLHTNFQQSSHRLHTVFAQSSHHLQTVPTASAHPASSAPTSVPTRRHPHAPIRSPPNPSRSRSHPPNRSRSLHAHPRPPPSSISLDPLLARSVSPALAAISFLPSLTHSPTPSLGPRRRTPSRSLYCTAALAPSRVSVSHSPTPSLANSLPHSYPPQVLQLQGDQREAIMKFLVQHGAPASIVAV